MRWSRILFPWVALSAARLWLMRPINVGALVGVVVSSAIYAIFGWMLLAQFTHWFRSYWIFGAPSLRSLRRMLEIDAARSMNLVPAKRPPMRRLAFNFLRLGLIVFALYLVFGGGVLLSLAIGISSFPLIRFLSKSFPPAAVLLAKSGKPAIDLQQTISRAMKPFDCISLLRLDPSRSEGTPEYPDADWLYFESFRTSDPTAWRAIVSDLLNMVPIVVIDARQVSPSVME